MADHRAEIIDVCSRVDAKGWIANHDGNMSQRLPGGLFLATPTARAKGTLAAQDLLEIDIGGKVSSGKGKVFSEWAMHRAIYDTRQDALAVVHAHPPYAMGVGLAGFEISASAVPEAVVSLGGGVPLVELGLPGSDRLMQSFQRLVPHYDAVLVAGNGVFTWGPTMELAYLRMELVEHLARCLIEAMPLGGAKLLAEQDVQTLLKKRSDAGLSLPVDPMRPHWFTR